MKTITGIAMGLLGYTAWKLSEPSPGEAADFPSRVDRLKVEWKRATQVGKAAGLQRRMQMEAEFESIFNK